MPPRFWAKVVPEPMSGCWLWTGALTGKGYGSFNLGKDEHGKQRTGVTHKMTVQASGVRIPDGFVVDHRCRTRCCCNPRHLEPVPGETNNARGESPSARNAKVTACPRGHAYTPENTYLYRRKRYCRECHKTSARLPLA